MHDFNQAATGVFEIWGAQLNAGPAAQDDLPTSGAPATITDPAPTELTIASTRTISIQGNSDSTLLDLAACASRRLAPARRSAMHDEG
ncbi:hypothetical protein ACFOD3_26875 [Falsiroseomonas tokyonensis]|uniref:Uncharacterized protein n=1 Tax=Falsiroseomonas tokyonensis TaxID=430521 RepID=A0ABV7C0P7_9PROT|nr:hypothetical protein [Falsiroseomonas tokyonensis]MBU8541458.1 hypothetical protein [Falsiroseomonas tokyonensis]